MQFCPKNREDIVRYYRNSYIKLREFNDQLFYIEGVDNNKIIGSHESGEKFLIYLNDETPYEVDYILPHKSFFQFGKFAMQLMRIPAKQYLRGLADSNTLLSYMDAGGKMRQWPLNFEVLKAYVNKVGWPTLTAAWGMESCSSVALSSRMMLNRMNRQLCVDFVPVATIIPNLRRIDVKKTLFMDEVKALIKNMNDVWDVREYVAPPKKERTTTDDLLAEMGEKEKQTQAKKATGKKYEFTMAPAALNAHLGEVE